MSFLKMVHVIVEGQHEFFHGLGKGGGIELENAQACRVFGCRRILVFLNGEWLIFFQFVSPGVFGFLPETLAFPGLGALDFAGRSASGSGGLVARRPMFVG